MSDNLVIGIVVFFLSLAALVAMSGAQAVNTPGW